MVDLAERAGAGDSWEIVNHAGKMCFMSTFYRN
jgi:hypothetical protein